MPMFNLQQPAPVPGSQPQPNPEVPGMLNPIGGVAHSPDGSVRIGNGIYTPDGQLWASGVGGTTRLANGLYFNENGNVNPFTGQAQMPQQQISATTPQQPQQFNPLDSSHIGNYMSAYNQAMNPTSSASAPQQSPAGNPNSLMTPGGAQPGTNSFANTPAYNIGYGQLGQQTLANNPAINILQNTVSGSPNPQSLPPAGNFQSNYLPNPPGAPPSLNFHDPYLAQTPGLGAQYNNLLGQGAGANWNNNPLSSLFQNKNQSEDAFFNSDPYKLQYGDNNSADPYDRFKNDKGVQAAIQAALPMLANSYSVKGLGASGPAAKGMADYMYGKYNDYMNQQQNLYQNEYQKNAANNQQNLGTYLNQQGALNSLFGSNFNQQLQRADFNSNLDLAKAGMDLQRYGLMADTGLNYGNAAFNQDLAKNQLNLQRYGLMADTGLNYANTAFNQNLARANMYQQERNNLLGLFSNYQNQLAGLAGQGGNAAGQLGQGAFSSGQNLGSLLAGLYGQTGGALGGNEMGAGNNIMELLANLGYFGGNAYLNTGAAMSNNMLQGSLLGAQLANAQNGSNAGTLNSLLGGIGAMNGVNQIYRGGF